MINVEKKDKDTFKVTVEEGGSQSSHTVTVDDDYYKKLTCKQYSKEDLVKKSFEFLLARESKESILSSFNLMVISNYFPEYEKKISSQ
jgi:hypothetical protein